MHYLIIWNICEPHFQKPRIIATCERNLHNPCIFKTRQTCFAKLMENILVGSALLNYLWINLNLDLTSISKKKTSLFKLMWNSSRIPCSTCETHSNRPCITKLFWEKNETYILHWYKKKCNTLHQFVTKVKPPMEV
jgi:hypothetical protein